MTEPSLPEESVFAQALDIASASERAAFLDRACAGNPAFRAEVEALLRAHDRSGDLLDVPEDAAPTTADRPAGERPGAVLGRYKLLQEIGEGGMGTVWMAEQSDPIQRRVAVKVVKDGMDTKQVLARFEAERQALALMDHPNIAKVFDADRTPSGRPYFVMELVKGQPITQYCDEKRLGVRERLELFADVCRAIQHAHQKGVIHRDLKPSNVLVAPYDGRPVVKVIDFGVAKATGQRLTEHTLFTGFGSVVGTPEYMSPEQAEVNNQDIDTRSDVYSLGVLVYELLTGSTPLTRKRVKEAALLEVLRLIREEEPPRPSTRLSESKDALPSISAQRQAEPAKLTRLVRGELDWIAMKALEKDRNRRYETANGFAMDVQRYLTDEAVQACPPSAVYRLRKFARRHKTGLLTAVPISLGLVMAVVVLAVSNVRVRQESDHKEQALREKAAALMVAEANFRKARDAVDRSFTLVSESDLFDAAGLEPLRKKLLEGALEYYKEFVDQAPGDPTLQAELAAAHFRIWQIYRSVNRYADSLAALRTALDIAEKVRREYPGNRNVLRTLATVRYGQLRFVGGLHAQVDVDSSDISQPIRTLERAAALWATLAEENPRIPDFQRNLGEVYDEIANLERVFNEPLRALGTAQKAFAVWEKLAQEHPPMVVGGREREYRGAILAVYLREGGHPEEAQQLFQRAIDFAQKQVERFPKDRHHRASLAFLYRRMGESYSVYSQRPKEAEQPWRRAISLYENLIAEQPGITSYSWHLGDCYVKLGHVLRNTGRRQEAEHCYAKALRLFDRLGAIYPDSAVYKDSARTVRLLLARLKAGDQLKDPGKGAPAMEKKK
jgi:serine/threonine protein kinase